VTHRARSTLWIALTLAVIVAAAAMYLLLRPKPAPRLTLTPARYDQLAGWGDDTIAAAIPALQRSCKTILARSSGARLDAKTKGTDFGSVGEWRPLCATAAALPAGDDRAARQFLEANFAPFLAGNNDTNEGLFTGYFEITLNGARQRGGAYQTPLYRRPAEPSRYTRAEIGDGALAGQGLELLWVDDPVDAFFLEIQGSGRVRLRGGGMARVGYDGSNGKSYVAVGRLLIERGEIPREKVTMAAIRAWMTANPKLGASLRRENPSYVFFREIAGGGPLGAQQSVLIAGHSLAVDRAFVALGIPIWIDVRQRFAPNDTIRRLVVAQDTGGAIKGPVRGDLFWGHGKAAADGAGAMNARGRYYLLLPKPVAARLRSGGAVGTH
jgi:membrane-bound lytic murein transglycosylase A